MKISVTLTNRIIIMAIVSIVLIGAVPYLSYYLSQKYVVEEAIITFNKHAEPVDSLFTDEFMNNPRAFEAFEYEQLSAIESLVELDLGEIVRKSKEPYGNSWLLAACGKIIIKMVRNLSKSILTAYIRDRIISSILSLLAIIFVFILGKELLKKPKIEKDDRITPSILSKSQFIYRLITSIIIIVSGVYLLICLIKNLITFIKHPPVLHYPPINASFSYYCEVVVIIAGLVILFSILHIIHSKRFAKSRNYLAFFWTVPVLAIIFNLYMDNKYVSELNNIIDTQNLNAIRQEIVSESTDIIYTSQQWYMQNEGNYNMKDFIDSQSEKFDKSQYGIIEFTANDTLLSIVTTGEYVTKEGKFPQVKASYNTTQDYVNVTIIK